MSTSTNSLKLSDKVKARRVFRPDILKVHAQRFMLSQTVPYVKNKTVIDVGAATGMYSYFWSQFAKQVYSFEAVPYVFDRLDEVASKTENIEAFNLAVGNKRGLVEFWVDDKRLSNSGFRNLVDGQRIEVNCIKLDTLFNQADFIKIDVEGNELDVLRGAMNLIQSNWPVLMVEIFHKFNNGPIKETFEWLFSRSYIAYFNLNYSPKLHKIESLEQALDIAHDDVLGQYHDYDFLFIRPD